MTPIRHTDLNADETETETETERDGFSLIANEWGDSQHPRAEESVEKFFEDVPGISPSVSTLKPIAVAAFISAVFITATTHFFPDYYGLSWAVLIGTSIVALSITIIAPSDYPSGPLRWLINRTRHQIRTNRLEATAESASERPQTVTNIDRFLAPYKALKRTDGALYGLVEVTGKDLSMESTEGKLAACREYRDFAMTVDSSIEMYSHGRVIESRDILADYFDRENDPDVQNNPALRHMVSVYQKDMRKSFRNRRTATRSDYIGTTVTEAEATVEGRQEYSRLADTPIVGWIARCYNRLFGYTPTDAQREIDQSKILKRRRRSIEAELNTMDETTARQVSVDELAALHEEYWTGLKADFDRTDRSERIGRSAGPIVFAEDDIDDGDASDLGGY
jgi:hypothetical protein